MKYLYLFSLIFLISCATKRVGENAGKSRNMKESHRDFELVFKKWDQMKKMNYIRTQEDVVIGYKNQDENEFERFIALCYYYEDNTREIRVNKKKYDRLSTISKQYIIFKQLAKCDTNLPPSYKTDIYGKPISLRYYDYIDEETLQRNWQYYINNVFVN